MSKGVFEVWSRKMETLRDDALMEYDRAKSEEDVLSYALFPAVATKFFEWRDNPHKDEAPAAEAAPAAKPAAPANNGPKTLYVEDLTNGNF